MERSGRNGLAEIEAQAYEISVGAAGVSQHYIVLDHQGLYDLSICVLTITSAASFMSSAPCRKQ